MLNIKLISFTYNNEKILPYFLDHYSEICNSIIVYDNLSTDKSVDIINSYNNTEVRINDYNYLDDINHKYIRNNAWKENRIKYDWIIIVDIDEFIYHPNLLELLESYRDDDISVIKTYGYNMLGEEFPIYENNKKLYDIIKTGVPDKNYSKCCIFNPNLIYEMNYSFGGHTCEPHGYRKFNEYLDIKLLHYKFFGFKDWKEKNDETVLRVHKDVKYGGTQYLFQQQRCRDEQTFKQTFKYDKGIKVI